MRRQYPKSELMNTVLCDQVRPELNQKMTYMGVYAGDRIVFHPDAEGQLPYRMPALAFVFIFKDGVGEFSARFSLLDPDGKPTYDVVTDPIKMEKGKITASIIQIQNVAFESEGLHTAVLKLERRAYEFPFQISSSFSARSQKSS